MNIKENIKYLVLYIISKFDDVSKDELHSVTYIISNVLCWGLNFKYGFHCPYLPYIEDSLGDLYASNFIKKELKSQYCRGIYSISGDGKTLLDIFKKENSDYDFNNLGNLIIKIKKEIGYENRFDIFEYNMKLFDIVKKHFAFEMMCERLK